MLTPEERESLLKILKYYEQVNSSPPKSEISVPMATAELRKILESEQQTLSGSTESRGMP